MINNENDKAKKIWIVIISVIMISIALIWIFAKGEALGVSVAR